MYHAGLLLYMEQSMIDAYFINKYLMLGKSVLAAWTVMIKHVDQIPLPLPPGATFTNMV